MWLPVVGLVVGVALGFLFSVEIPLGYVKYTAIMILAAIDTILGGLRAQVEDRFDLRIFLSGFVVNAAFAALLTGIGDLLGLDIYLGAVIAFSIRIFDNVGFIRRDVLTHYLKIGR
ncbi:MAG: small basic family protein [Candidatus Rokubacteria bacterium]|jgi:small basic protein|nr:small basic family protein [Candidatus Rokubacteria bacterium]